MRNIELFKPYQDALVGMPVSHIWMGFMQTLSIEVGTLTQEKLPDGTVHAEFGEMSVSFMPNWRFEKAHTVACSSATGEDEQEAFFKTILGARVARVDLGQPVAELSLVFDNGYRLTSFSTHHAIPEWTVTRRGVDNTIICVTGEGDTFVADPL